MPKMFIHSPAGTFPMEAREKIATRLSDLGLACERLADTPQVRAGIWVYFVEHEPGTVFRAGRPAEQPITSLKIYTIKGGLDAASRKRMIEEATAILGEFCRTATGEVPVFAGVIEVPEDHWGMYGKQVHLAAMLAK